MQYAAPVVAALSNEMNLIYNHRDAGSLVYHYTRIDTLVEKILPSHSLRLGAYTGTNDPKETKDWTFNLYRRGSSISDSHDVGELSRWLTAELKMRTSVFCCSRDTEPLSGDHLQDVHKRGFCKPRMWASYAGRFTGVCLALDRVKLEAAIIKSLKPGSFISFRPILYEDRGIVPPFGPDPFCIDLDQLYRLGRAKYPRWHIETYARQLFFEKARDWRDECEVRWVVFSPDVGELYFDIGQVLVGIVFGDSTPSDSIDEVISLTERWPTRHLRLTWTNASPWYDFYDPRLTVG